MPCPSLHRRTLILLLVATLATSWASAAGSKAPATSKVTAAVHQDLLSRAWSVLASLWGEEGCNLDPDGRCRAGSAQVHTDTGCHLDPNGRCRAGVAQPVPPRSHADTGCNLDPDGRCTA